MLKVVLAIGGLLWLALVWGTCAYAVFWLDRSGWWFLLAFVLSTISVKIKS